MVAKADRRRIAIACQGGGSHTAFTAGVLKRLLEEQAYEIVALSGTSGGAVCALLTWCGLSQGDRRRSIELLEIVLDLDLNFASKLDRSPAFIADLMERGEQQAAAFLESYE